eukprot:5789054-Heterocapsa_arctica.AAC.1
MQLLVPPGGLDPGAWLAQRGGFPRRPVYDTPALGWEFCLDQAKGEPATAPGDPTKACRCCRLVRGRSDTRPHAAGKKPATPPEECD